MDMTPIHKWESSINLANFFIVMDSFMVNVSISGFVYYPLRDESLLIIHDFDMANKLWGTTISRNFETDLLEDGLHTSPKHGRSLLTILCDISTSKLFCELGSSLLYKQAFAFLKFIHSQYFKIIYLNVRFRYILKTIADSSSRLQIMGWVQWEEEK